MLTGLFVPLITPLAEDGSVALAALTSLAHELLDGGATGLVALGTTGEPATLAPAERVAVADAVAAVCRDRSAPLIIGAGTNDTAGSVAAVRSLARWPGATAALVPVPYYTLPSEEGIVAHLTQVAAASPVPVIVYNVPHRAGRLLPASAMLRLAGRPGIAGLPGIVGVKQAVGALDADTALLLAGAPAGFSILAGDDAVAPALLALGAAGAITASAHVSTQDYAALVAAWLDGQVSVARELGHRLAPLSAALFAEPNPTVIKAVLHAQHRIPTAAVRLPLLPAQQASVEAALAVLAPAI